MNDSDSPRLKPRALAFNDAATPDRIGPKQGELLGALGERRFQKHRGLPRRQLRTLVDYAADGKAYRDFIHDISGSGVFIETRIPFAVGQQISMTFIVPDTNFAFKNSGRIVRTSPRGVGVKFDWQ